MSICAFCDETFFKDRYWVANNSEKRAHHCNSEEWAVSMKAGCTICILLMSKAKDLYFGDSTLTNPVSVQLASDIEAIRSMETDWGLPLYEGTLLSLNNTDGFLITFRPSSAESITVPRFNRQIGIQVIGCQSFVICPAEHCPSEGSRTSVVSWEPSGTSSSRDTCEHDTSARLHPQVRQWLLECNMNHTSCRAAVPERSPSLSPPARLIAIDKELYTNLQLIDTAKDMVRGPYTTLRQVLQHALFMWIPNGLLNSYCWGPRQDEHPPKLTTSTRVGYENRIDFDALPKTFQEAIELTAALDIYYIWIDSMCILQDDGGDDFRMQAPLMEKIYGGSYCNIAAANSRNCSQGLYRATRLQQPAQVVPVWGATNADYAVLRSDLWEERLLAPRVLHFAAGQLFWQCRSLTACSLLPRGFPPVLDDASRTEREWMRLLSRHKTSSPPTLDSSRELYDAWRSIVQAYSLCSLTRSSDKLPAIEGVANAIMHATGDEYCAGLWRKDLVEQLAWRVRMDLSTKPLQRDRIPYRAPSWAWPSVDSVVEVPEKRSATRNHVAKILELNQNSLLTTESSSTIDRTTLRLRGHIFQLMFVLRSLADGQWMWLHSSLMDSQNSEFAFLYPDDDLFLHMDDPGWSSDDADHNNEITYKTPYLATVLMCAWSCEWARRTSHQHVTTELYSGHGLAIEFDQATGTWTRVGLVTFEGLTGKLWDHLQKKRMTPYGDRILETEAFDAVEGHIVTLV
ncbi:hypothetical protein LTR27_007834 [Elasticomyces elasticus]|nr:hypothetical protein LTR27_007834 [Elasticomyces elasticus]